MADAMISDLTAAAAGLNLSDLIEVEQGVTPANSSKKGTLTQLLTLILANIPEQIETVTAVTPSGGFVTLDLQGGKKKNFTVTLTGNVTLAFSNLPAAGFVGQYEIEIKQDGTGGWTFTLPASHKALGGSDTAIAVGANAVTVLSGKTFDQGTTWRYAMQESA